MHNPQEVLEHLYQKSAVPTPRPPVFAGDQFTRTTGTAPMLATTYSLGDLGIE